MQAMDVGVDGDCLGQVVRRPSSTRHELPAAGERAEGFSGLAWTRAMGMNLAFEQTAQPVKSLFTNRFAGFHRISECTQTKYFAGDRSRIREAIGRNQHFVRIAKDARASEGPERDPQSRRGWLRRPPFRHRGRSSEEKFPAVARGAASNAVRLPWMSDRTQSHRFSVSGPMSEVRRPSYSYAKFVRWDPSAPLYKRGTVPPGCCRRWRFQWSAGSIRRSQLPATWQTVVDRCCAARLTGLRPQCRHWPRTFPQITFTMYKFEAPMDFRIPISRVRSMTAVYIAWKMTIKPMAAECR